MSFRSRRRERLARHKAQVEAASAGVVAVDLAEMPYRELQKMGGEFGLSVVGVSREALESALRARLGQ